MNSKCYCKILALSVIFLFIGVSFSSGVSVDPQSIKANSENDCNCKENDSRICEILTNIYLFWRDNYLIPLEELQQKFPEDSIMYNMMYIVRWTFLTIIQPVYGLGYQLDCGPHFGPRR